jgi:hypothetical protein
VNDLPTSVRRLSLLRSSGNGISYCLS